MFLLTVADIVTVGGSVLVTGKVAQGRVAVGDAAVLRKADGTEVVTEILRLETFGKPAAEEGDNVGLTLKEVSAAEIDRGDQLVSADQGALE
ncbi:MAG: hypothetical protein FWH11_14615 [Micrococcales bacterium]|nr:hypothetical protein [Micrococcales bacterium]